MSPKARNEHTAVRRDVTTYLRARFPNRAYVLPVIGGLGMAPGTPDILACIDGKFIAIEIKTGAGRLSDTQKQTRATIEASGGAFFLVHNLDELILFIEQLTTKKEA